MSESPPEWIEQAIDRFNDDRDQTRDILEMAGWPTPGEVFGVEFGGVCDDCHGPVIRVVEPGAESSPVALFTEGCLACDLYDDIDGQDLHNLADDGEDPFPG